MQETHREALELEASPKLRSISEEIKALKERCALYGFEFLAGVTEVNDPRSETTFVACCLRPGGEARMFAAVARQLEVIKS